jgi:hypothetical protein
MLGNICLIAACLKEGYWVMSLKEKVTHILRLEKQESLIGDRAFE